MVGVANAAGIPQSVDPQNYPIVWTEDVYNGSSSAITSGYVVQWDFDTSDVTESTYDDRCNWVKKADAADDVWTAGVMLTDSCAAYTNCSIAIRGPVRAITDETVPTVNTTCGTAADGKVTDFSGGAADKTNLGIVIKAGASNTWSIIFVNPTNFDDG